MKRIAVILVCLGLFVCAHAQTDSLSVAERNAMQGFNDTIDRLAPDFVEASLLIAEPGEAFFSCLGHAFFRMECPAFKMDYVFSYEGEDIREHPWRCLAGNLKMGMVAIPTEEFMHQYMAERRGVKQYKLHLAPTAKQELWRILDEKVAEGMDLPYDMMRRGCAQSCLQDLMKVAPALNFGAWNDKYELSLREITEQGLNGYPWTTFLLHAVCGNGCDKPLPKEKKVVVPADLLEVLQAASIDGDRVITEEGTELVPFGAREKAGWCTPLVVSLFLLALSLLGVWREWQQLDWLFLGIQTIIGCFITCLLLFSKLPLTEWNWLIIPFNPLPALAWHWRRYWSWGEVVVLIIWIVAMLLYPHRLTDPAYIVLAASLLVMYMGIGLNSRKNKYNITN